MWWALEQEGYMHQKLKELGGHLQAGVQTEESRPVQRMEQTHREKQRAAGPVTERPGLRPPGTGSA